MSVAADDIPVQWRRLLRYVRALLLLPLLLNVVVEVAQDDDEMQEGAADVSPPAARKPRREEGEDTNTAGNANGGGENASAHPTYASLGDGRRSAASRTTLSATVPILMVALVNFVRVSGK